MFHRNDMLTGQTPQPDVVTTPLASVQEEKEENEWPQNEENTEPQENGTFITERVCTQI